MLGSFEGMNVLAKLALLDQFGSFFLDYNNVNFPFPCCWLAGYYVVKYLNIFFVNENWCLHLFQAFQASLACLAWQVCPGSFFYCYQFALMTTFLNLSLLENTKRNREPKFIYLFPLLFLLEILSILWIIVFVLSNRVNIWVL